MGPLIVGSALPPLRRSEKAARHCDQQAEKVELARTDCHRGKRIVTVGTE
jgi:hypothetical protein